MIDKDVKWAITKDGSTVIVLKYGARQCKVALPGNFESFKVKTSELSKAVFLV